MGRVANGVLEQIEEVAARVAEIRECGGSDSACQGVVIPFVEALYKRVETGTMSQSTLLKGVLPCLWKEVGSALETTPANARERLFSFDRTTGNPLASREKVTELRRELGAMRSREKGSDEKGVEAKHERIIEWGPSIYDALRERAIAWLTEGDTESDRIVRLIASISFFTGRRPWSEVANTGEFEVIDGPQVWDWVITEPTDPTFETDFRIETTPIEFIEWADAWLRMRGAAKPSYKEKLSGASLPVDFPILGIAPERIVEAVTVLRDLEKGKSWFRSAESPDKEIIQGSLQGATKRLIDAEITPIFEPITVERGHGLPGTKGGGFTMYHFRSLWASRLHAEIRRAQREEGLTGLSTVGFAKSFLGHRSRIFGASSLNYTVWEYVDE